MITTAVDFLRSHTLLRGVPVQELEAVALTMLEEKFQDGASLIEEGSYGNSCYFIMSGQVQIVSRNLIGHSVTLDILGEGALIGEVALFMEEKRTSGVQAIGEVTALRLEQDAFTRLAAASPLFHESLSFSARIRSMHAMLSKATIWAAIPNTELRGLAEVTIRRKVHKGDVILTEGRIADKFYMISEGRFEVRRGRKKEAIYTAGDYFGEMDLLSDCAHTGTITALENGELMIMGRDEFHFVLQQYEPVRRQFHEVLRIRKPDLLEVVKPKLQFSGDTGASEVATASEAPMAASPPSRKERWIDVVLGLGGLFILFTLLAVWLKQPMWSIAALITGGFLGPVSFVSYIRSSQTLGFRPAKLAVIFACSAVIAIPSAYFLEHYWLIDSGIQKTVSEHIQVAIWIAVIEEAVKLLVCLLFLRARRISFLMDAVVFGAAAGMGFAAIESVLYGWTFLQQHTTTGMLAVLWVRALLSPFGHGTWTAIAAAGVWYGMGRGFTPNRTQGMRTRNLLSMIALLISSIVLHAVWDYPYSSGLWKLIGMIAVGVAGLALLYFLLRRGAAEENYMLFAVNPSQPVDEKIRQAAVEGLKDELALSLLCEACGTVSPASSRYCGRCGQALRK